MDKELLDFAQHFSENYKQYSVGEYFSENKKYHIKYLPRITDHNSGQPLSTGARVGLSTGVIELDKSILDSEGYTPDYVYFIIIWCVIEKDTRDAQRTDGIAIQHYLETNRSKKNLLLGYAKLFSNTPTELNKKRIEEIQSTLYKN